MIVSMPAIVSNCLISGVATEDAIVSGEAPASWAETKIVGKSARGNAATGSRVNAIEPASRTPTISRIVATGRRMKISEKFI